MPTPTTAKIKAFKTSKSLNTWLRNNHDKKEELYVKIYKKSSNVRSVTWNDVVIETLCWGWIDGVKKSYDEHAYLQRITPRRAKSAWSKINTRHVERLTKEGRMQAPGLVHVEAAKADGRWENAYLPPSEVDVPQDFVDALKRKPKAKAFYDSLAKSNRYAIAYGLTTAKKAETRERRFQKYFDMMINGEKPDFGFRKK
ncbi:YdeI/OmpD-associated family protein [Alteromonas oceanisediminis]|uniref:YdeI/OmpD-associated family protein n=1 Tax=Alteromonas oceanisediminis TaxID=2836180 RepID=UPI001BD9EA9E|nr:YdeI/OmpD-associated family protein [Alteromonas oceanisediminis]MBT0585978.1 YdeI/OmpD-associated family protein [Alteromonas oceanisediminis]